MMASLALVLTLMKCSGFALLEVGGINRIYHRSLMQTEKSKPESKGIMPETRFTEFLALSVDPRVWVSRSASEMDD